jgi:hypothetical protein
MCGHSSGRAAMAGYGVLLVALDSRPDRLVLETAGVAAGV